MDREGEVYLMDGGDHALEGDAVQVQVQTEPLPANHIQIY